MSTRNIAVWGGAGCLLLLVLALISSAAVLSIFNIDVFDRTTAVERPADVESVEVAVENEGVAPEPTFTAAAVVRSDVDAPSAPSPASPSSSAQTDVTTSSAVDALGLSSDLLSNLYTELNPGVVSIQVLAENQLGQVGQGAGSGFVLDNQGHVVTNNHVVAGARQIIVVFANGIQREVEIIGLDDDSDLGILRVNDLPEGVRPLPLANSDGVRVGELVIAIGNPFGLGTSMTTGIVSAIGRAIDSGATPFRIPQAIQTDAAINPGNSGGPLLNLAGEVIGVNAQIRSATRSNSGVGFAIPSNVVRLIAPSLIEEGRYRWPYLGIGGDDVSLQIAALENLDSQSGAFIASIEPRGPADAAGLRGGDVVLAANREPINNFNELLEIIAFSQPGDLLDLTILRNGREREVGVELGARPDNFGEDRGG